MPAPSRRIAAALLFSLLIHGGALLALRYRTATPTPWITPPAPIEVVLLPPTPAAPAAPPAPSPPAEAPKPAVAKPPPEKKAPPKPARPAPEPRRVAPAKTREPAPAPAPTAPPPVASAAAPEAPPAPSAPPAPPAPPVPPAPPAPPAHVGASIPASYAATNRPPVQPARSIRNGEEGTVILRVQVRADGSAGQVEVAQSSRFPMLDEAAVSAVQNWRFNPATLDGKPITEWFRIPINFKLSN